MNHIKTLLAGPLALDQGRLHAILPQILNAPDQERTARTTPAPSVRNLRRVPMAAANRSSPAKGDWTVLVPLFGLLVPRDGPLNEYLGNVGLDVFRSYVNAMAADTSVGKIIIEVDSPGGSAYGVQETSDAVRAAAKVKPVVAVVNSVAASGAYWVATAASELIVTPSGEVGSIGCYMIHVDESKALEAAGLVATPIIAGERKIADHSFGPLSDLGRQEIETLVNDYHQKFMRSVAQARGASLSDVKNGFGRGGMVRAEAAVRENMADAIGTIDQVLAGQVGKGKRGPSATASERSPRLAARWAEVDANNAYAAAAKRPLAVSIPKTSDRLTRTAYHEAGHAVAGVLLGARIDRATIVPVPGELGSVSWKLCESSMDAATAYFAGVEAEKLLGEHHDDLNGAATDISLGFRRAGSKEVGNAAWASASVLVLEHRGSIKRVAEQLLAAKTLTGDQIKRLMQ